MTTEAVLLLVISVLILGSVYFSDNGPKNVFKEASPHLGGKIERSLSSGHSFKGSGERPAWEESQ